MQIDEQLTKIITNNGSSNNIHTNFNDISDKNVALYFADISELYIFVTIK